MPLPGIWRNSLLLISFFRTSLVNAAPAPVEPGTIPVWSPCTPGTTGTCAPPAKCICQSQYYSQCRIAIDGSWTPIAESWSCPWLNESASANLSSITQSQRQADYSEISQSLSNSLLTSTNTNAVGSRSASSPQSTLSFTTGGLLNVASLSISMLIESSSSSSSPTVSRTNRFVAMSSMYSLSSSQASSSSLTSSFLPDVTSSTASQPHFAAESDTASPTTSSLETNDALIQVSGSILPVLNLSSASNTRLLPLSPTIYSLSLSSGWPFPSMKSSVSSTESSISSSALFSVIAANPQGNNVTWSTNTSSQIITHTGKINSVATPSSIASSFTSIAAPYLGCPAGTDEDQAGANSPSVCDWQTGNTISNLSSTAKNETTGQPILPSRLVNPDQSGDYMDASATLDKKSECLNPGLHQLRTCWAVLNVTGYLQDWVAYNQKECDQKGVGFADCFLYLQLGGGANCSTFTGRSQCPSPDWRTFSSKVHGAQAFYVAYNIWNLQNWFFSYWLALTSATTLTSNNVAALCKLLDVPLPKPFPLLEVLAVMAFALGLISPGGYGALVPALGSGVRNAFTHVQVPGEYLLRGIQSTPMLARNLLASSMTTQTEVQIGNIESGLAQIVSQLQTNVQNAIIQIMGNFSLFMDFASDGYFSAQIENLNTITQNLTMALNTYVVSQALTYDKVVITRALETSVYDLATNMTAAGLAYDIGCTQGYDIWGMCGKLVKNTGVNYTGVLEEVFAQGITTPELLFQGSQVCADAAGGTQGNAPGSELDTKTGIWNAECVANMKICTWDLVNFSQDKPFTDCPGLRDFALEGCGAGVDMPQASMPIDYIGPWLYGGQFNGVVCNRGFNT